MALTIAGCGSDDADEPEVAAEVAPPRLVDAEDIEATEPGSPERAVFEWFQAVQFGDYAALTELTAPDEIRRVGASKFRSAAATVSAALGKPEIVDVRVDGDDAIVRLLVLSFGPDREDPANAQPETMELVQSSDHWQINDIRYVVDTAKAINEAAAAAE